MTNILRLTRRADPSGFDLSRRYGFASLLAGIALSLFGTNLTGAPRIDVGVHDLLPDKPNQIVTLEIDMAEEQVRGMNVRAQLGDGLGPLAEPIFSRADFDDSIWSEFPTTTSELPVEGAEQFMQAWVNFSDTGRTIIPNGVAVRLTISTVGIFDGTYDLSLQSESIGEDTDLILPGGQTFVPDLIDGQVRIVPEPGTGGTCLIGLFCLMLKRRRCSLMRALTRT